jgi:dipeptidase
MCDTLVALPAATADGSTILAKNSDREPNEAQAICFYPRQSYPAGAELRCTYFTIPQARETCAVLLSRPFWMWGAEMGANEHGVIIGNEAVFAKVKAPGTGLTGMDLLRLALERGATARAALDVITNLLETHGQGGNGGYQHKLAYHNSFLIADRREAWVLETVDRHWAAQRVADVRSISNGLTIGRDFDLASANLIPYAVQRGWCRGAADFDFARCYSDFLYTRFSQCRVRQPHTTAGLRARAGQITVADMMALLRSHGPTVGAIPRGRPGQVQDLPLQWPFTPAASSNGSICAHYGDDLIRVSQTTGSLVAHLRSDGAATFWLTGTSAPCLSLFKPFYLDASLPDLGPAPAGRADPAALWWQGERLHRAVILDYATRHPLLAADRDALEAAFLAEEAALHSTDPAERGAFSARCLERGSAALAEWTRRVEAAPIAHPAPWLYRRRWQKQNRAAEM